MTTAPYPDGAGYVRGRYVPIAEATIPVTDWGFTRSDAVYDVVHVFKHGFFRLDDHLDRFMHSMAQRVGFRHRKTARKIEKALLHRCVALAGLGGCLCRDGGAERAAALSQDRGGRWIATIISSPMRCRGSTLSPRMFRSAARITVDRQALHGYPMPRSIRRSRTISGAT